MNFQEGQRVYIKPGTFHNSWTTDPHKPVRFVRYMAGNKYAIVDLGYALVRIDTEDLVDLDNN